MVVNEHTANRFKSLTIANAPQKQSSIIFLHELGHVSLSLACPENEMSVLNTQRTILSTHETRVELPNGRQSNE